MYANRWRSIALLMGYAALGHFNRVGITVAGDELFIPKLGITETEMGWVYTNFLIVYTIGMMPGGWLIDRLGSARVLTGFGLGMGTFVVLTGALGWLPMIPATLFIGLLVIRGLAGVCNAPLHPGAAHVVSDVMPEQRRATANGMVTAGALVGIACCYPAFGWLMDRLTWQWAFVVSGSALIGYGVLWRLFTSPSRSQVIPSIGKTLSLKKTTTITETTDIAATPSTQTETDDAPSARPLLRQSNLWLITLSYAAYGYFQYLFFYWMGYYFKDVLDVPDVDARWASFWIMLAMGAGMAIGGRCTDIACGWLGTNSGRRAIVMTGMGLGAVFGLIGVNVESFASVSVFPELDDAIEVEIDENDLRVDTYRAGGAGGQHVNKTDSAVRLTHLPSGIVVQCQNERSQHKNRASAMKVMRARLYEHERRKRDEELAALRGAKLKIGFGSQIRSYTLHPQQRVKDHRTNLEMGNVDAVFQGDLDRFIRATLVQRAGEGSEA